MRKYQKAAIVMAMLGSVSFLGAGVGHADDGGHKSKPDNRQHSECSANDNDTTGVQLPAIVVVIPLAGVSSNDSSAKHWNDCDNISNSGKGTDK